MEGEKATKISKSYSNTVFSESEEKALASYIVECGQMFYGLSTNDLSVLAYQYAIANNKSVPTSWQTYKAAGKTWVWGFRKRHNLALRTPENTSMARAKAFNEVNVKLIADRGVTYEFSGAVDVKEL